MKRESPKPKRSLKIAPNSDEKFELCLPSTAAHRLNCPLTAQLYAIDNREPIPQVSMSFPMQLVHRSWPSHKEQGSSQTPLRGMHILWATTGACGTPALVCVQPQRCSAASNLRPKPFPAQGTISVKCPGCNIESTGVLRLRVLCTCIIVF